MLVQFSLPHWCFNTQQSKRHRLFHDVIQHMITVNHSSFAHSNWNSIHSFDESSHCCSFIRSFICPAPRASWSAAHQLHLKCAAIVWNASLFFDAAAQKGFSSTEISGKTPRTIAMRPDAQRGSENVSPPSIQSLAIQSNLSIQLSWNFNSKATPLDTFNLCKN